MTAAPPAGDVYWLTGLSGAGKSTLGKRLARELRNRKQNVVLLDGDSLRIVFGNDLGHSAEDRLQSAMRNSRLCKLLSEQGINVVCATISMSHECQRWNRENIPRYFEIYIRVPLDVLRERDAKKLYARAERGEINDVVGVDIPAEEPDNPDLVIDNFGSMTPENALETICEAIFGGDGK